MPFLPGNHALFLKLPRRRKGVSNFEPIHFWAYLNYNGVDGTIQLRDGMFRTLNYLSVINSIRLMMR